MDILIKLDKGIPRTHESLVIDEDNEVRIYGTDVVIGNAIELPPHGNLTEKSAFWDMLHEICVNCNASGDINRYSNRCIWCKIKEAYEKVYQTPTVLEANYGTDN